MSGMKWISLGQKPVWEYDGGFCLKPNHSSEFLIDHEF